MAKKNKETPETKAPETKEPETTETKKSERSFLNRVPEALIHDTTKAGVKTVSIPDKDSITGYGSIFVSEKQMFDSTKKDTKEPIPGLKNINLGSPDRLIPYSIATNDGYEKKEIPAADLAAKFKENQQAYYAERNAERAAEKDASKAAPEAETTEPEAGV